MARRPTSLLLTAVSPASSTATTSAPAATNRTAAARPLGQPLQSCRGATAGLARAAGVGVPRSRTPRVPVSLPALPKEPMLPGALPEGMDAAVGLLPRPVGRRTAGSKVSGRTEGRLPHHVPPHGPLPRVGVVVAAYPTAATGLAEGTGVVGAVTAAVRSAGIPRPPRAAGPVPLRTQPLPLVGLATLAVPSV